MSRRLAAASLLLLSFLLSACMPQNQRQEPGAEDWTARATALQDMDNWQLQGKIGVRAAQNSGSAALNWQQQEERYRLVLSGALGMGKLVLWGDQNGVSWTDDNGEHRQHPDAQALVSELWGWSIPVEALRYWVRGIPQPQQPFTGKPATEDEAAAFAQAGWTVQPVNYRDTDGHSLPTRIRLQSASATLTVLVNRWTLLPP